MVIKSCQDEFATNLKGHLKGTPLYQPLDLRDRMHRVGDIAFFDGTGTYQWIHNAFYQADLQDLLWPWLDLDEERVVRKSKYQGTKFAFGGAITMEQKEMKGSAQGSVKGVAGGTFVLKVSEKGQTMSALVLGEEPIRYWRLEAAHIYALRDWFAQVEMHAWARVDGNFQQRPKEILLILGQHLTPTYAVSHKRYGAIESEVILEFEGALPSISEAAILGGYKITKAHASVGFDQIISTSSESDPTLYSISLELAHYKSGPIQRFRRLTMKVRATDQYRFFEEKSRTKEHRHNQHEFRFVKWGKSENPQNLNESDFPAKVPLVKDCYEWFLVKTGDEYGIQYNGEDPDKEFPSGLSDEDLINILLRFRALASVLRPISLKNLRPQISSTHRRKSSRPLLDGRNIITNPRKMAKRELFMPRIPGSNTSLSLGGLQDLNFDYNQYILRRRTLNLNKKGVRLPTAELPTIAELALLDLIVGIEVQVLTVYEERKTNGSLCDDYDDLQPTLKKMPWEERRNIDVKGDVLFVTETPNLLHSFCIGKFRPSGLKFYRPNWATPISWGLATRRHGYDDDRLVWRFLGQWHDGPYVVYLYANPFDIDAKYPITITYERKVEDVRKQGEEVKYRLHNIRVPLEWLKKILLDGAFIVDMS